MIEREEIDMAEFSYQIVRHIGVISKTESSGWQKELNFVSYNGREPKYDIRDWSPGREKMAKGITLNAEEARALLDLLKEEDI